MMEKQNIHSNKEEAKDVSFEAKISLEKEQTIYSSDAKEVDDSLSEIETSLKQEQILSSSSTKGEKNKSDETDKTYLKNKQITSSSSIFSHNKIYCRTRFESTAFEYVWTIDRFASLFKIVDVLTSAPMLEAAPYRIQMEVFHDVTYVIKFYILTETPFTGLCNISITFSNIIIITSSMSGYISNKTLLCETTVNTWPIHYDKVNTLKVNCNLEIFHQALNDTMHMSLQPLSTILSNNLKSENSNIKDDSKFHSKKLTFIINNKHYSVPIKQLYATNSTYFLKLLCEDKDSIEINENPETFQEMLSYITTGLIPQLTSNYNITKFQNLLMIANKYDVQNLKLLCEHRLLHCISIHNALTLLIFATLYRAEYLQKHAAQFIKLHFKEIIHAFDALSKKHLNIIFLVIQCIEKYNTSPQSAPLSLSSRLIKRFGPINF
ncbi:uncharacterized protein [Anoplolepis gracilipes]|uniref:uncharacterized protein n=1 Tax=Anoplolepis gracilipes TaxID=354296 RepID=UPI003BA01144